MAPIQVVTKVAENGISAKDKPIQLRANYQVLRRVPGKN